MREHPEEYFLLISDELKAAYQVGSLPLSPKNDSLAMSCAFIGRTCTSIKEECWLLISNEAKAP